jgi:2-amino-4-hydroxy-6-hydroxymethyldihydropteridine diphosphokinase
VDIITYGDIVSSEPVLTLPHPRAAERAFVLYPWSLIDPSAELNGERVGDLAASAADFSDLAPFDGFQDVNAVATGSAVNDPAGAVERP